MSVVHTVPSKRGSDISLKDDNEKTQIGKVNLTTRAHLMKRNADIGRKEHEKLERHKPRSFIILQNLLWNGENWEQCYVNTDESFRKLEGRDRQEKIRRLLRDGRRRSTRSTHDDEARLRPSDLNALSWFHKETLRKSKILLTDTAIMVLSGLHSVCL